jgi:hypothetical protein
MVFFITTGLKTSNPTRNETINRSDDIKFWTSEHVKVDLKENGMKE